ncbi:hypothetical protein SAMN05444401_0257 [Clostridium amylolyticum]|uniref:Uncharacterized protein n=1 Tax=Clostridium amylolyticum TaxID=1121298 RepID=A0A1M6NNS4_9CLOT|nr:hypothetical protein [Clostridium amylolyticum]SHJ97401.1 hypothetical protein SAMN05444401_0257 [Clostridium amylolyticum]
MRVKCKNNKNKEQRLTLNKNYSVYEAEYLIKDGIKEYITFKIEDDYGSVIPYEANNFEIISDLNNNYTKEVIGDNEVALTHSFISTKYFWAKLYDDDHEMIRLFIKAKKDIYSSEMKNDEILEIINGNNFDERDFVIDMLIDQRNDYFIENIIRICKIQLEKWIDNSNLETLFKYLSTFENDKVNEFFIDYLSENEKGNEILDNIVYDYFNN